MAHSEIFRFVRVDLWDGKRWKEILYWHHDEWETRGSEAFEAIIGVITKVAAGEKVVG